MYISALPPHIKTTPLTYYVQPPPLLQQPPRGHPILPSESLSNYFVLAVCLLLDRYVKTFLGFPQYVYVIAGHRDPHI